MEPSSAINFDTLIGYFRFISDSVWYLNFRNSLIPDCRDVEEFPEEEEAFAGEETSGGDGDDGCVGLRGVLQQQQPRPAQEQQ